MATDSIDTLIEANIMDSLQKDPDGVFRKRLLGTLSEYEASLKAHIGKGLDQHQFQIHQELLQAVRLATGHLTKLWSQFNQK
jgi:hypothetical protein